MVEIILDPSIRDWVVLPMVIIFGCSAMVRHYVTLLLKSDKLAAVDELRPMCVGVPFRREASKSRGGLTDGRRSLRRNTVKRAQMTRINSKFITPDAFAMRKARPFYHFR